jgi:hypothetical protein
VIAIVLFLDLSYRIYGNMKIYQATDAIETAPISRHFSKQNMHFVGH